MFHKYIKQIWFIGLLFCLLPAAAQQPFFKDAIQANRDRFYSNTTATITKYLSAPLNAETEEDWASAFEMLSVLQYKPLLINSKVDFAVKNMTARGASFKYSLLRLLQNDYQGKYAAQVKSLFQKTGNDFKLFAMCANYLLNNATPAMVKYLQTTTAVKLQQNPTNQILVELNEHLRFYNKMPTKAIALKPFMDPQYLPGQVIIFSFQRPNRDYPGIAIVRDTSGNLVRNTDGSIFQIGQLARSMNNFPYYISMGNTPQGIFRMAGFGISKGYYIGPTPNIQLTMPFEYKANHFYQDSTLNDTSWSINQYQKLLPLAYKTYRPLYQSYYAGKIGRSEIISHGTTVNPEYYKAKSYYPYTPTAGCLATKEIWDNATGYVKESDQLKLDDAVKRAGGAKGYLIVISMENKNSPVTLQEILLQLQ